MSVMRGPHTFSPIARWGKRSKHCWYCFLPRDSHPITRWVPARPYPGRRRWF